MGDGLLRVGVEVVDKVMQTYGMMKTMSAEEVEDGCPRGPAGFPL
jgi:hypothetical protein